MRTGNAHKSQPDVARLPLGILLSMVAVILMVAAAQGQQAPIANSPVPPTPQTTRPAQAAAQQDLQSPALPPEQQTPIDTQPAGQANTTNQQPLGSNQTGTYGGYGQQNALNQNQNQDATFTERSMMPQAPGQLNQAGNAANRPGELGVYVVESAGPGVVVTRVSQGSAAAQAGMRTGDRILQINGESVDDPLEVTRLIRSVPAGSSANLEIWRNGAQQQLAATLQPRRGEGQRNSVGYRGDASSGMNGDLAQRTVRLEQQLATVMRELQQLRQEMMQLRTAGGAAGRPGTATSPSAGEGLPVTGTGAPDQTPTQPGQAAQQDPLEEPATTGADDSFPFE